MIQMDIRPVSLILGRLRCRGRARRRVIAGTASIAMCCVQLGCASAAKDIAEAATPTIVDRGLRQVALPKNQAALDELTRSPAGQHLGYGVGVGVGRSLADELLAITVGDGVAPDGSATQPATAPSGSDIGARLQAFAENSIAPVVNDLVRSTVRQALKVAMAPDVRADANAMTDSVGEGLVGGITKATERDVAPTLSRAVREHLGPGLATMVHNQLRPALHELLEEEIRPTIRRTLDDAAADALQIPTRPNIRPSVVENARNVSFGASYGSRDALISSGVLTESGHLQPTVRGVLWGRDRAGSIGRADGDGPLERFDVARGIRVATPTDYTTAAGIRGERLSPMTWPECPPVGRRQPRMKNQRSNRMRRGYSIRS